MIVEDTSLEITVPKKIDEISSVSEDMTTVLSFFVIKCYLTNDGFTHQEVSEIKFTFFRHNC